MTFQQIKHHPDIVTYLQASDAVLTEIGYTEHGLTHASRTAAISRQILQKLGYDARTCELARIAGYTHDIGNLVNRQDHAQSGAVMMFGLLQKLEFPAQEIAQITCAIGHHDEKTAAPVSPIAAALILADKSDVRRRRVRDHAKVQDIHDRVNYAARSAVMRVEEEQRHIILRLNIDTQICPVMDYFEIFLDRMVLCRKSATYLQCDFELIINDTRLL